MNTLSKKLNTSKFDYTLPEEKIAQYPLNDRSTSKLLVYRDGDISHRFFKNIVEELPANSTLIMNDTRVIAARLLFQKKTGSHIEVFLLKPSRPLEDIQQAMRTRGPCSWQCLIGNLKKWKNGQELILKAEEHTVRAKLINRETKEVEINWTPNIPFAELIDKLGKIPLPPYLNRELVEVDKERYQTVYAINKGAVAAPTAGLHFTDELLEKLKKNNFQIQKLTLHIGAGTFQPVKKENIFDHEMHDEQAIIRKETVKALVDSRTIISVGTTSLRALESLYWFGVKLIEKNDSSFYIPKLFPYEVKKRATTRSESLKAVLSYMENHGLEEIRGQTEIFIFPGYDFKLCDALITNFHLPKSTLIMLIAAFVGGDWRKIYAEALKNNYRFLSYGDSSLLVRK